METMVISCPECGTKMRVPESSFGKKVRCKKCEEVFPVKPPGKAAVADEDEAPAPARAIKTTKNAKSPPAKDGKSAKPDKPAAPAKPETIPLAKDDKGDDPEDDGKAYGLTDDKLGFRCPQCAAEMESEEAIICLNCGFNSRERVQTFMRKTREITGGDKFLWLLPGILCVIAVCGMIGYWFFHHFALVEMMIDNWEALLAKAEANSRRHALDAEEVPWYGMIFKPWFELWMALGFGFASFYAGKFAIKRLIINPNPPEVEYH